MSTCPECYDDIGCTCVEDRKIKELEAELAMINAEYRDCPESKLTKDAIVVKLRATEAENAKLREAVAVIRRMTEEYVGERYVLPQTKVDMINDTAKQALATGGE